MTIRFLSVLPAAALLVALQLVWLAPSAIAADDMVWSFSEGNDPDNKGRMTARLAYGIPEADAAQVAGVCEARAGSGLDAATLTLGADIGKLKDGKSVKLRFSGGGFDHSVPGSVIGANAEVGITGVLLDVPNDDPLWQALTEKQSIDYLVPGYSAAKLDLKGARKPINDFIAACRSYAEALAPKKTAQAQPQDKGSAGDVGVSAKEAFEAAKELGTIEAWEAFLNRFPRGFRADLARAYVKRIGGDAASKPAQTAAAPAAAPAATPAPVSEPKLSLLNLGPGSTPWQNRNTVLATAGNQNVYAASVKGSGLELVTYCRDWNRTGGVGQGLFAVLREDTRGQYPDFEARIRQGMGNAQPYQGGRRIELSFSNGKSFDQITLQGEPSSGELLLGDGGQAISQGLAFQEVLGANTMTILAPPFAATFQLTGSRAAICKVFQRCGVTDRPECAKYAPRSVRTQPSRQQPAATKRKATKKKSGCRSGSVFLEGQCVPRSLVTEFCGPGYTRRGSKCVFKHPEPQSQVQPKAQPKQQPNAALPGAAVQILNQIQQQRNCSGGRVRVRGKCKCPGNQIFSGTACVASQPRQSAPPPVTVQQTQPQQAAPNAPPAPPPPRPATTNKCPGGLVPNPQGGCSPPACGQGQIPTAGGACVAISDRSLKRDIAHITTLESGIRLYTFRYLWDESTYVGVMAQDLLADETTRDAVVVTSSGFYAVDYQQLGLKMVTLEAWQSQGLASVRAEPALN